MLLKESLENLNKEVSIIKNLKRTIKPKKDFSLSFVNHKNNYISVERAIEIHKFLYDKFLKNKDYVISEGVSNIVNYYIMISYLINGKFNFYLVYFDDKFEYYNEKEKIRKTYGYNDIELFYNENKTILENE